MSLTSGLSRPASDGVSSRPRRLIGNLVWGVATILRAPQTKTNLAWITRGRVILYGMLAIVATVLAMFYVDAFAAEAVKRLPKWFHTAFDEFTDFGKTGWFSWPTGLFLLAVAMLASPSMAYVDRLLLAVVSLRVGFLFLAIGIPSLAVTIVKRFIGRVRPLVGEHIDPFLYKQWVWHPDYASMPSGHATTAFAAAIAIGALWPRLRVPMFIYAVLIAASRVVIDAHYVSDAVAGAIAGTVGALLVRDWFAARRLVFAIGPDGKVDARPGPSFARIKLVARKLLAP